MDLLLPGKIDAFVDNGDRSVLRRESDTQDVVFQFRWATGVRRGQKRALR